MISKPLKNTGFDNCQYCEQNKLGGWCDRMGLLRPIYCSSIVDRAQGHRACLEETRTNGVEKVKFDLHHTITQVLLLISCFTDSKIT